MSESFVRGDHIRVIGIPPAAHCLPAEVQELFVAIVGRTLRVDDVNSSTGCVALNVHADGSQASDWCEHTVWLEQEYATLVARASGRAGHP